MRYQSALVLSTLAVGQAVATANNLRHAGFHARHAEQHKRVADDVDWNKVAYDLKDVNWNTVNYGGGQATPTPAPAAPSSPAEQPKPSSPAADKPKTTQKAAPSSTKEETPEKTETPSTGGDIIGDIFDGLEALASKLGTSVGVNAKTKNDNLWIGDDGDFKATFTNDGNDEATVICWNAQGMWINANKPLIFFKLSGGAQATISMAKGFSGGCGAARSDSDLTMGLLNESILEFTANSGANGCFDISREINMKGIVLSAKGSKCTSGIDGDQLSCVFGCASGTTCGKGGGDYNIIAGAAQNGPCMIGKDPYTQDPSGGCQMGETEHMHVTIHSGRSWPAGTF